jgi:hypothetical protein
VAAILFVYLLFALAFKPFLKILILFTAGINIIWECPFKVDKVTTIPPLELAKGFRRRLVLRHPQHVEPHSLGQRPALTLGMLSVSNTQT